MDQDALFSITGESDRRDGAGAYGGRWGGSKSTKGRARCRAMLPAACPRCGGMITAETPESEWHAGHVVDRALLEPGADDSDVVPEHAACNTSAGGKLGATITNARKTPVHLERERVAQWW